MATLDDIALAAGVSPSTVSRVLNNRTTLIPVGPATRQRILAVARDLDYRPNLFAQGLKTKRSRIIGLAIRDFSNPLWGGLLEGIVDVTKERGYHAILHNMADEREEEQTVEMLMTQIGVDGLLLIGDFPGDRSNVQRLLTRYPVAVAVCRSLDSSVAPRVNVDDRRGIWSLLEYLHGLGHRQIGFVGLTQPEGFADRVAAYRDFMDRHGLPVMEYLVDPRVAGDEGFPSEDELVEIGSAGLDGLLDLGRSIGALVCACDPMAMGALLAAHRAGLVVPDQLSIAGFDDAPMARYCTPSLTTVRHPVVEMGRAAAALVIGLAEGTATRPTDVIPFPPELIVRESTAPLCG